MTVDHNKLNAAIEQFYEAAVTPELWQGAMQAATDALNAKSCHFFSQSFTDERDDLFVTIRMDPDFHRDYLETYADLDVRFPRILNGPVGKVLHGDLLWTEDERLASPVYHENLLPFGLYEVAGAQLAMPGRLSWLGFSLYEEEPWKPAQLAAQQHLLGHARQALRIHLELSEARSRVDTLGTVLSRKGMGVILLTPRGKVLFANSEAEELQKLGLFTMANRNLIFRDSGLNFRFATAMTSFGAQPLGHLSMGAQECVALADLTGQQIGVRFLPLLGGIDGSGSVLAVTFVPMDTGPGPDVEEIKKFSGLFGLTVSEEFVLTAVASGQDLSAHSRKRGIAIDTARKHLKNVLAKTNCRSQKDLLRLVERFCFFKMR
ncbi:helix-turn-helix transcriptional regulator [Roseibium sp. SCP14]|uniref:helix-turn-helix transcriptional regulator n=1 Tax=Roseibium sp. SCP14 TaxID=3141375 RepID=UPI003336BC36